jgi:hypothetical protein
MEIRARLGAIFIAGQNGQGMIETGNTPKTIDDAAD